jgi:ATP-dependent DNA helicase RecG
MTVSDLLHQEEGKTLEFKRDLSSPRVVLKTLVAFANTAGGKVVVGVADKSREVLGVAQPLDEEERLCSLIADSISPRLVPDIEMITVKGKTLLVIEVFLSGSRSHWLKAEGPENGVYVRLGSTNRKADRELTAELRRSSEGVSFDELPMPALSVEDLDTAAIKSLFRDQRKLRDKDLLTLRLLTREQGKSGPPEGQSCSSERIACITFRTPGCSAAVSSVVTKRPSSIISSYTTTCLRLWTASCCF